MNRLGFVALTVFLAACRGNAPADQGREAQAARQSKATESPAPAPLTLEWTGADIEKNAFRIGYGPKPAMVLQRTADGDLFFKPETEKDHIALPFTPLASYGGQRSLELIVDADSPGGNTCAAHLQDQAYNVLTTVPCTAAGEQRQTVDVKPDVTGVRVLFLSATREPMHLPNRVRVIEHRDIADVIAQSDATRIPLERLEQDNGTVSTTREPNTTVTTTAAPYSHAAGVDLREFVSGRERPGVIAVTAAVVRGQADLCVLNQRRDWCLASQMVDRSGKPTIYLRVENLSLASRLVVRSSDRRESGEVTISAIELHELAPDSRLPQ